MRGKNKCKILKEIRQKIADENDIPFVTQECTFQGECKGTCPKCEAELRYLEQQLEKRQRLGKTVTVAALAASLMATLTACPSNEETTVQAAPEGTFFTQAVESTNEFVGEPTETVELIGEVPAESQWGEDVKGEIESEEVVELEGDVEYIYEEIVGMLPIDESTCEIPTDGDE